MTVPGASAASLRDLAGAGLLQTRQGSGVFVIATEPAGDWAARLIDVHEHDGRHGRDAHAALVEAVRDRDPVAASGAIGAELRQTLALLQHP
ncbi:hypothetical protein [Actinomadura sp. 9N407]|uniref:hypothetical protein n=1 Tax=Actinomadura sp. 9N407 TaxID=3375154 RepID=UPI0037BC57C9